MKRKLVLLTLTVTALTCSASVSASDGFDSPSVSSVEDFSAPAEAADEFTEPESTQPESTEAVFADDASADSAAVADTVQQDVPIDEAHFPDQNFRSYLSSADRDKNQDGILQASEIAEITELAPVSGKFWGMDMTGYQYLTSLQNLDLVIISDSADTLDELDFSTLPNLQSLAVHPSSVSDSYRVHLDLSQNSQLKSLSVSCLVSDIKLPTDCNITDYTAVCDYDYEIHETKPSHDTILNTADRLPKLTYLTLKYFNDLDGISFSRWPQLRELSIIGDDSDEGTSTTINTLDLSSLSNLETLRIENGFFTDTMNNTLRLESCTALRHLNISNPRGTDAFYTDPFLDLGSLNPSNINIDWPTIRVQMQSGGYFDMVAAGWDTSRILNAENGLVQDSRLYMFHSSDHSGEACISYYLNDSKKAVGKLYVTTDNLYSPEVVDGLTVTARTTNSLTCKWTQAKDTYNGYALYVQDSETHQTLKKIMVKKGTTTAKVTGLKPGERYLLIIRSYRKADGKNYYSPYYNGTEISYTTPKTPTLKTSVKSGRRVQLKWTGTPTTYENGYTRYVLEYKDGAKGTYQRLKVSADSKGSYTTKALKKGHTYYFHIRSYVKDTNSYHKAYSSYSKTLKVTIK